MVRTSSTWDFFTPIDDKSAKCHFCEQILSYKTSISNLKVHLKRKHSKIKVKQETEPLMTVEERLKNKKSKLWEYFTPEDRTFATCDICNQMLSYRSSINNLQHHLTTKHPSILTKSEVMEEDADSENEMTALSNSLELAENSVDMYNDQSVSHSDPLDSHQIDEDKPKRGGKRSPIWKFFTPQNDANATCNLCDSVLSYKSSTSNLRKHLRRKHPTLKSENLDTFDDKGDDFEEIFVVNLENEQTCTISKPSDDLVNISDNQTDIQITSVMVPKHKSEASGNISSRKPYVRGRTSTLWNFFTPEDDTMAQCNFCDSIVSYKSTISNLRRHFERKHPHIELLSENDRKETTLDLEEDTVQGTQSDIPNNQNIPTTSATPKRPNPQQSNKQKPTGPGQKKCIDDALLRFITKNLQPFSTVEGLGFKMFTRSLNPTYPLPCKKTMTSVLLPAKFDEIRSKAMDLIQQAQSVTITMNSWTSSDERFVSVFAHFINNQFQMQSLLLDVFPSNAYTDSIANELNNIVSEWGIEDKILLCVSDCCDDLEAATKELEWAHLGCIAHTFNSVVNDALNLALPLIQKVSNVTAVFKKNTMDDLESDDIESELEEDDSSNVSRWNSVYTLLQQVINLKEEILKDELPMLAEENFVHFEELKKILDPMESTAKIMTNEKQISLSLVILIINGIRDIYQDLMETREFSKTIKQVLIAIVNGIDNSFKNVQNNSTVLLGTFLDPRFKHVAFTDESTAEKAKKLAVEALTELIEAQHPENDTSTCVQSKEDDPLSVWSFFDKKVQTLNTSETNKQWRAVIEIERYMELQVVNRSENPLDWWKENAYNFPFLSKLIPLKFGTVATSVPCGEIFSKSRHPFEDVRSVYSVNKLRKVLFLYENEDTVCDLD